MEQACGPLRDGRRLLRRCVVLVDVADPNEASEEAVAYSDAHGVVSGGTGMDIRSIGRPAS